jgi:hypothetical protein
MSSHGQCQVVVGGDSFIKIQEGVEVEQIYTNPLLADLRSAWGALSNRSWIVLEGERSADGYAAQRASKILVLGASCLYRGLS